MSGYDNGKVPNNPYPPPYSGQSPVLPPALPDKGYSYSTAKDSGPPVYKPEGMPLQAPSPHLAQYTGSPPMAYPTAPTPPLAYAPPNMVAPNNAVLVQPVYLLPSNAIVFGSSPLRCLCVYCNQPQVTRVEYQSGCTTFLFSGLCCLFGGVFGCFLIPFCMDACKDVTHHCSMCGGKLGTYNR